VETGGDKIRFRRTPDPYLRRALSRDRDPGRYTPVSGLAPARANRNNRAARLREHRALASKTLYYCMLIRVPPHTVTYLWRNEGNITCIKKEPIRPVRPAWKCAPAAGGRRFFLAVGIWTMHFVGVLAAPIRRDAVYLVLPTSSRS